MTDAETKPTEDPSVHPPTADELKEQGNQCVRNGQFTEAVFHYTHAIKQMPNDAILYSNRSLAFLKINQLYYANDDAEKAIQLKPDWAKGYFRKAEVQISAGQFDTGLLSYGRALQLQPNDASILNAAKKAAALGNRELIFEKRVPWVGAGVGIILGVIIVISDQLFVAKPTLRHPSLMVLLVIAISLIGFAIARGIRYFMKLQKKGMLDPPVDLLEDFKKADDNLDDEDAGEAYTNRARYTKAQARQRFKKGKT